MVCLIFKCLIAAKVVFMDMLHMQCNGVANFDIANTVRSKALSKAEQVQLQRLLAGVHDKLEDCQGLLEMKRRNRTTTGSCTTIEQPAQFQTRSLLRLQCRPVKVSVWQVAYLATNGGDPTV